VPKTKIKTKKINMRSRVLVQGKDRILSENRAPDLKHKNVGDPLKIKKEVMQEGEVQRGSPGGKKGGE